MFWLSVLGFVVAWAIVMLIWACCAAAKEGDEAFEELNESIRKLHQVALSVARTSGCPLGSDAWGSGSQGRMKRTEPNVV